MPSSHSATVSALAVSVFLFEGVSTSCFIAWVFAAIVIRDCFGIRRAVEDQTVALNHLAETMPELGLRPSPIATGHQGSEVLAGMAVGVGVALVVHNFAKFSL